MFGLLALGQQGIASLAYDRSERMGSCRDRWRSLPRTDASAVDEGRVRVPIVAVALQYFRDDLLRMPHHQPRSVYVLALLHV